MLAVDERVQAFAYTGVFRQAMGRAGLFGLRRGYYALFQPLQSTVRA